MAGLELFVFAEFVLVALLVPGIGLFHRRVIAKVAAPLLVPLTITPALLIYVRTVAPGLTLVEGLRLQLLACCFGIGLAGLAALAGRRWPWGGPLAVTLLGLLALASPFWGDILLNLSHAGLRAAALKVLVAVNPLFIAARELHFDWTRGTVIYQHQLTRLGEHFAYRPPVLLVAALSYALVGLLAASLAGLLRQKGRPSEYLIDTAHF